MRRRLARSARRGDRGPPGLARLLVDDGASRRSSACTSSWRSAAPTCRSSSRCSTATRAGRRPRPASCSATICSSSPARSSARAARSCRYIMCRAMNRSISNVIFGGFGADEGDGARQGARGDRPARSDRDRRRRDAPRCSRDAKSVVIVPGYGMAVAQAQHPVREIDRRCCASAASNVRFAIHPVAGRLPGHMNVLLAEAERPLRHRPRDGRDQRRLPRDRRRARHRRQRHREPAALDDPSSPIYGMPVLEVWKAARSCHEARHGRRLRRRRQPALLPQDTRMLFGDAKKNVDAILDALRKGANGPIVPAHSGARP